MHRLLERRRLIQARVDDLLGEPRMEPLLETALQYLEEADRQINKRLKTSGDVLNLATPVNHETMSELVTLDPTIDPERDGIVSLDRFGSTVGGNPVIQTLYHEFGLGWDLPIKRDVSMVRDRDRQKVEDFFMRERGKARETVSFGCKGGQKYQVTRFQLGEGSLYVSRDPLKRAV